MLIKLKYSPSSLIESKNLCDLQNNDGSLDEYDDSIIICWQGIINYCIVIREQVQFILLQSPWTTALWFMELLKIAVLVNHYTIQCSVIGESREQP